MKNSDIIKLLPKKKQIAKRLRDNLKKFGELSKLIEEDEDCLQFLERTDKVINGVAVFIITEGNKKDKWERVLIQSVGQDICRRAEIYLNQDGFRNWGENPACSPICLKGIHLRVCGDGYSDEKWLGATWTKKKAMDAAILFVTKGELPT